MDNAQYRDGVCCSIVSIRHYVGRDDANPNIRAERWARRAAFGIISKANVQAAENSDILSRGALSRFSGKAPRDVSFVELGQQRDDDLRRQDFRELRSAAMCALCSSSVTNSPRSTAAMASST